MGTYGYYTCPEALLAVISASSYVSAVALLYLERVHLRPRPEMVKWRERWRENGNASGLKKPYAKFLRHRHSTRSIFTNPPRLKGLKHSLKIVSRENIV